MQSRRNFVKGLLTLLLAASGGAAVWKAWPKRSAPALAPAPEPDQPAVAPPNAQEPLLSLFLLSDIHMTNSNSSFADKLHLALADVTQFDSPVQTIVLGGDLVDGARESDYQLLRDVLSSYKLPALHAIMGNHEYYHIWYDESGAWSTETGPNGKTDAQARERFQRFTGHDRPYHDAWVNGVHLIMLSQEAYVQERPEVGEGAWYSDEQLAWLAETMKPHADGSPALLFIHQPLPPDGTDGGTHRLIRNKEFRSILRPYQNVFVFSGHTHQNLERPGRYVRDTNLHWFSNASIGLTRAVGAVQTPVQGLYIQVYADRVLVRGREFSDRTWIKAADWRIDLALT